MSFKNETTYNFNQGFANLLLRNLSDKKFGLRERRARSLISMHRSNMLIK